MKTFITLLAAGLFMPLGTWAQNNITLDIDHMLGDESFAFFQEAGQSSFVFEVDRLQYYISDISVMHDGGLTTPIEDVWLLIDASSTETHSLGTWDVDNVESISFHIGVGPDVNNEDPAAWPSDHPLYPQNPSMHWGWSSGYRFVAMEGMSGSSETDQVFEIHALGNDYYYETSVEVSASASGGELVIPIRADYIQALNNMDLSSGTITHGSFGVAVTLLQNFSSDVFSPGVATSLSEFGFEGVWAVSPNPSDEQAQLIIELPGSDNHLYRIRDIQGRILHTESVQINSGRQSLPQLTSGTYLIELVSNERVLTSTRWVVR